MKNAIFLLLAAGSLMLASCTEQSQKPAPPATPKPEAAKLANRFFDEVANNHNPALLNEILGDDFVSHQFPTPGNNNKAVFSDGIKGFIAAFPDIRIGRNEQYEQGDKVFTYGYWEATHNGPFMGIPATGKKVRVEFMDIWRVSEGKIRENWVVMDIAGLLTQLGVMPPPSEAPAK